MWRVLQAGVEERFLWFKEKAQSRHARMWLGAYSFIETILIPFPTDPFLAAMVYADRKRVVWLTVWTTLTSIAAAVLGYAVAYVAYDALVEPLLATIGIAEQVVHAAETLGSYVFIATLVAAFSPIPYSPIIFAAGFLRADFFLFVLASVLGRGVRFAIVAAVTYFFGVTILPRLGRYATIATVVGGAIVVFMFITLKLM